MSAIKRWDVYDIADELADVPRMLSAVQRSNNIDQLDPVKEMIQGLTARLRVASRQGGTVGPAVLDDDSSTFNYPGYEPERLDVGLIAKGLAIALTFSVAVCLLSVVLLYLMSFYAG